MTPPVQFQGNLLLNLMLAGSRQALLDELLIRLSDLRSATLWWRDDEVQTMVCHAGEQRQEGPAQPLPHESRYLISLTPGVRLSPEVLAALCLRLLYLDALQQIAELKEVRAALETAARRDALTGLLNRHALDHDLHALDVAGNSFVVVLIDLDGFKRLNDQFGHALGDSLLRAYGSWLTRMTGAWGQAYRLGGDEFLVLVSSFPGSPTAFSQWAHERLQVPFVDGISASIGIAWRQESWRVSDVIGLADQRMYQAKKTRLLGDGSP
ncbi:GGDEF domain-containing protein [Deinococcus radiomollis]|uniref:GGDEF domain-containing protein n=1 Tax=Deinococcus radiomollis TaxID=468916 RepID=UPI003892AC46